MNLITLANNPSQVALMARAMKELFPGIELGSVDGFQGREKEVRKLLPLKTVASIKHSACKSRRNTPEHSGRYLEIEWN